MTTFFLFLIAVSAVVELRGRVDLSGLDLSSDDRKDDRKAGRP